MTAEIIHPIAPMIWAGHLDALQPNERHQTANVWEQAAAAAAVFGRSSGDIMTLELAQQASDPHHILVIGGGAVGLASAISLAQAGLLVTLVGPTAPVRAGRTVALLHGSVALLDTIGVWPGLKQHAAALGTMRLVDATGSLFRPPPVSFRASEIGLPAFGYNVDNAVLEDTLRQAARQTKGLTLVHASAVNFSFTDREALVETDGNEQLAAQLVVAADGRNSPVRKAARIGVRTTRHPQTALTALFAHDAPHREVSTEFHTRQGPFTLVPMPDGQDGVHRSSLVWVMSPEEAERRHQLAPDRFAHEAERQCAALLGQMSLRSAIGEFPIVTSIATRLTAPRLVLIGEAAHALPPIGAQGLNLSFRDVTALTHHLRKGRSGKQDLGDPKSLAAYARSRAGDIAMRTTGVGLLNGSLLSHGVGMDAARGLGLAMLGAAGPLRRLVMRHGLAPESRSE